MNVVGQYSSVIRMIDPSYPSNLLALGLAVAGGVDALWQGVADDLSLAASFVRAILAGMMVFIGWALARELDPDHAGSAGLAGFLTLLGLQFVTPQAEMVLIVAILLTIRILAGTTGVTLKPLDYLIIPIWWGIGSSLLIRTGLEFEVKLTPGFILGLIGIVLLVIFAEYGLPDKLKSVGDFSKLPLYKSRVKAAIYVALTIVAFFLLLNRADVVLPLIAVSYAVVMYMVYRRVRG